MIEALIFAVQKCDVTEKQAVANWVGSPSFEESASHGLGLYPFLMTQLAKEAKENGEEGKTGSKRKKSHAAKAIEGTGATNIRRNKKVNPLPPRRGRGPTSSL